MNKFYIQKNNKLYDDINNLILKIVDINCPNLKTPKYSSQYYLNAFTYIMKNGVSYRQFISNPLISKNIKKNHYSTIFKKFNLWTDKKIFELTYKYLLLNYAKKVIKKNENYILIIDSTFIYNLFGIELIGKYYQNKKRSIKISLICDEMGIPFNIKLFSANTADCTTIIETLDNTLLDKSMLTQVTLLGDKGYIVKNKTKNKLLSKNINLITYKKKNQIKQNTEKEIMLLKTRYKVENVFSNLKSNIRIFLRYEKNIKNYMSFIFFSCILSTQTILQNFII